MKQRLCPYAVFCGIIGIRTGSPYLWTWSLTYTLKKKWHSGPEFLSNHVSLWTDFLRNFQWNGAFAQTQCGNCGNLLLLLFGKHFMKVTILLKKLLNNWFDKIFLKNFPPWFFCKNSVKVTFLLKSRVILQIDFTKLFWSGGKFPTLPHCGE